jgi:hypothetical protein
MKRLHGIGLSLTMLMMTLGMNAGDNTPHWLICDPRGPAKSHKEPADGQKRPRQASASSSSDDDSTASDQEGSGAVSSSDVPAAQDVPGLELADTSINLAPGEFIVSPTSKYFAERSMLCRQNEGYYTVNWQSLIPAFTSSMHLDTSLESSEDVINWKQFAFGALPPCILIACGIYFKDYHRYVLPTAQAVATLWSVANILRLFSTLSARDDNSREGQIQFFLTMQKTKHLHAYGLLQNISKLTTNSNGENCADATEKILRWNNEQQCRAVNIMSTVDDGLNQENAWQEVRDFFRAHPTDRVHNFKSEATYQVNFFNVVERDVVTNCHNKNCQRSMGAAAGGFVGLLAVSALPLLMHKN